VSIWTSLPPDDDRVDVAVSPSWSTDVRLTVWDEDGEAQVVLTREQARVVAEKLAKATRDAD